MKNSDFNDHTAFEKKGLYRTPINKPSYIPLHDELGQKLNFESAQQLSTSQEDIASYRNIHDFSPSKPPFPKTRVSSTDDIFGERPLETDFVTQRKKNNLPTSSQIRIDLNYEVFRNNQSIELDTISLNLEESVPIDNYKPLIESRLQNQLVSLPPLSIENDNANHRPSGSKPSSNNSHASPIENQFPNSNILRSSLNGNIPHVLNNRIIDWSVENIMTGIPIKDITDLIKEYKGEEKDLNSYIKNIDKLWSYSWL